MEGGKVSAPLSPKEIARRGSTSGVASRASVRSFQRAEHFSSRAARTSRSWISWASQTLVVRVEAPMRRSEGADEGGSKSASRPWARSRRIGSGARRTGWYLRDSEHVLRTPVKSSFDRHLPMLQRRRHERVSVDPEFRGAAEASAPVPAAAAASAVGAAPIALLAAHADELTSAGGSRCQPSGPRGLSKEGGGRRTSVVKPIALLPSLGTMPPWPLTCGRR